jgi:thiol-disulfide isomerase/thioredoxin
MRPAFAFVLALLFAAPAAHATKPGDRAPDFTLKGLDGSSVKLSALKGQVVVLDFWASWCVPCKKELPALDALQKRWSAAGKPVTVLAVGVDKERAKAEKLLAGLKVSSLTVALDPDGKTPSAYEVPTMPSSYVIDAKGIVKHVHSGYSPGDEKKIAAEVEALLK